MNFVFFFNYTTALLISISILSIFAPEDPAYATIFKTALVTVVTWICWKWGRYSIRKQGQYIYIHNFPECHKVIANEVVNLTLIEKHVLINTKDGRQLTYYFLFGPSGAIHESAQSMVIDQTQKL